MAADRGMMKWGGFMMPEHSGRLTEWLMEDMYEMRRELSEEQTEIINARLTHAMETREFVTLTYYNDREKRYQKMDCRLLRHDIISQSIRIIEKSGQRRKILLQDVFHVENE